MSVVRTPTGPSRVSVSVMTDASPIPTGPSSDSPSRPSTRLGAAAETAPPVLAGVLETATSDSSIRPQDDLFRFVNGGWLATAEIPADRPSSGAFTVLRDEAGVAANEGLTLGADYYKWARINLACAPDVARRIVDGVLALDALR